MVADIQLYKQIERLSHVINGNTNLTSDERLNVVSDAFLTIKQKMDSGAIPSECYEEYKGYVFQTVKNRVFLELNKRSYKRTIQKTYLEELENFDPVETQTYNDNTADLNTLLNAIDELPVEDQAFVKRYLNKDSNSREKLYNSKEEYKEHYNQWQRIHLKLKKIIFPDRNGCKYLVTTPDGKKHFCFKYTEIATALNMSRSNVQYQMANNKEKFCKKWNIQVFE